jgi:hypothetical protein
MFLAGGSLTVCWRFVEPGEDKERKTMSDLNTPSIFRRLLAQRLGVRIDRALERLGQERPRYPRLEALPEDRARSLAAYDHRCAYCQTAGNASNELGVDLLVPARRGGTNHPSNLVAACAGCTRDRQGKHLDAFIEERLDLDASAVYARIARATARQRARLPSDRSVA